MTDWIYIYGLFDPDTNGLRYIGQTKDLQKRLLSHFREKNTNHKCYWVQSLINQDKKPTMEVLDFVQRNEADKCEKYWIRSCKQKGYHLVNFSDGGKSGQTLISAHMRPPTGKAKYKGVVYNPQKNNWYARAYCEKGQIRLGTWETEEDAARIHDSYMLFLFGSNVYLNFQNSLPLSYDEIMRKNLTYRKKGHSSHFVGVRYRSDLHQPWLAYFWQNGKQVSLGKYNTEEEAAHAYQEKHKERKGE